MFWSKLLLKHTDGNLGEKKEEEKKGL